MLRKAAHVLAAATIAAVLLIPAVSADAAPSSDVGWVAGLLDAFTGWLPAFGRATASEDGEALPGLDPNGLTAASEGSAPGQGGKAYPNIDPNGLTTNTVGPQSQTTESGGEAYPNLDPDG